MKKMKGIRTILALLLVFVLVFGGALSVANDQQRAEF